MLDPLRPSFGIRLDHLKTSVWNSTWHISWTCWFQHFPSPFLQTATIALWAPWSTQSQKFLKPPSTMWASKKTPTFVTSWAPFLVGTSFRASNPKIFKHGWEIHGNSSINCGKGPWFWDIFGCWNLPPCDLCVQEITYTLCIIYLYNIHNII